MLSKAHLREIAGESGLEAIGFTNTDPFDEVAVTIRNRVEAGLNARLAFTYADPQTAAYVVRSFKWARSLVVVASSYLPTAGSPAQGSGLGRIARFAVDDAYQPLKDAMAPLVRALREDGAMAETLVDDNRLVDRAAAVRAGIAWWGKNTMAMTPSAGPWLLLGSIVTDHEFEPDPQMVRGCGTCEACLPACPTGALIAPGVLDARRCLAAIAQAPGWIPVEYRTAMADRIYGCDDCLEACPPGGQRLSTSTEHRGTVDLVDLIQSSDDGIRAKFDRFYFPKNDPNFLRRNALVALGNTGDESSLGLLAGYLDHEDPLLAEHAAWAAGRIGGDRARAMCEAALEDQTDESVRVELRRAIAASSRGGVYADVLSAQPPSDSEETSR